MHSTSGKAGKDRGVAEWSDFARHDRKNSAAVYNRWTGLNWWTGTVDGCFHACAPYCAIALTCTSSKQNPHG